MRAVSLCATAWPPTPASTGPHVDLIAKRRIEEGLEGPALRDPDFPEHKLCV
jgi:hypothetical protein